MSYNREARSKTSIDEDKLILENLYNMKEEPDIEHSQVQDHSVYEDTVDFHSDYEIKIEETDIKVECFNNKMRDSPDICSFKEMARDHNNQNESTESCSSRRIEFINVAMLNEQLLEVSKDATKKYDNNKEYDEHQLYINSEKGKEISSLTDETSFTLATHEGAKTFKKELTKSTNREVPKHTYICDVCNKGFKRTGDLVKHKRIHTGDKPYVCDICNKGFTQSSNLLVHKLNHSVDKPHVCDVCNKGFTQPSNLVRHKLMHSGVKPYVCDICNKRIRHKSSLIVHKRIHTGDKPYVCDVCNKGFTQSSHLKEHKRTHTGDKPCVCDVCNKGFTQSRNLLAHKRVHTST